LAGRGSDIHITVLTNIPSPYQVDLFNAIASESSYSLSVIYVSQLGQSRKWVSPDIRHDHCYLDDNGRVTAEKWVRDADLDVFSGYHSQYVRSLIKVRASLNKPWVFWGERPGIRFPGLIGRIYRKLVLAELHRYKVPIWGIGQWGLDGYQKEFGDGRLYINVPYFSDLSPFFALTRSVRKGPLKFLFSGKFISRKGVDLMMVSFKRLHVEFHLVGGGPLEEKLKRKSLQHHGRIILHGFKQMYELADIYSGADILCAPSRYDGWGLIVPEALAAGMPVISTDRTGAARELINDDNGWLVEADNVESLYLAMKAATEMTPDQLLEMTKFARDTAKSQHVNEGVLQFKRAIEMSLEAEMSE